MKTVIRPETEMKDSGITWIGNIPKYWKFVKLNYVHEISNVGESIDREYWSEDISDTFFYTAGVLPIHTKYENFPKWKYTKDNDLLLSRNGTPYIYLPISHSVYTDHIIRISVKDEYDKRFVRYCLQQSIGAVVVDTVSIPTWSISLWNKQYITVPPLSEQQVIADYLDETCSKIDEIIAEAKASIDEYEKLKQATIDENILSYDSVHIKLRQLGSLKNGLNFSHSDDVANIKFLGVGCFKDNMILSEVDDFADEHIDFEIPEEYLLSNGDIVFVRSNGSKELVGRSIMVENIDYPVTFSGFCIRFRNMHTELVDNRFLLYYFRTTHFKQSLLKYSNDSTNINNLNQEMLNAIRINAPVIAEQKLLVKKMEEQVFVFDSLIAEKESLINDLEAYKKSLIYEVVTGKRRVV